RFTSNSTAPVEAIRFTACWTSSKGKARARTAQHRLSRQRHLYCSYWIWSKCCIRGGLIMRETRISLPELALVAGTRAALGAGVGLLLADRFGHEQRRAVGWTLLIIGALTTIPLGFEVFGGGRMSGRDRRPGHWSSEDSMAAREELAEV